MILENTIKQGSKILKAYNIGTPELDAEIILSNIMEVTREFLILKILPFLSPVLLFLL